MIVYLRTIFLVPLQISDVGEVCPKFSAAQESIKMCGVFFFNNGQPISIFIYKNNPPR